MIFDLKIKRLALLALPEDLRQPLHVAWIEFIVLPYLLIYEQFMTYRSFTLQELNYNGQTIMLEKCLNDKMDLYLRRIYLNNIANTIQPTYIIRYVGDIALDMTYVGHIGEEPDEMPMFTYNYTEWVNQNGLRVVCPIELQGQENRLKSLLKRFLIASVKYTIVYY